MRGDQIFASMNIMMLKSAVTQEEACTKFLEPLKETALKLAQALSQKESSAGRGH